MKKNITPASQIPELTIGLDLSDRSFQFCELNAAGEIVDEGRLKLDRATLRKYLAAQPQARVALETGGQSAWVKQAIEELGHEAVVANARELQRSPDAAIAPTITTRGNWRDWRASIASC